MQNSQRQKDTILKNKIVWETVAVLILTLYPLRHIGWGLDLWDTGYNYANFQYMGLDHMDPMWLYSTYLANGVGHFLTLLPFAGTLKGMNFYTGLFVSVLAVVGYFFATRKLQIYGWITFLGELAAISLCWCPTALLYNYLTYVLLLACVAFLYVGLTKEKKWCLYAAGVCLGSNVLVRFSNLPEAALIVAVWAFGVIEWLEERKIRKQTREKRDGSSAWGRTFRRTLWCLSGYLSALAALFGYIHIRYGLDNYIAGIGRLFAMTDNATDYKATSMLYGMIYEYVDHMMYWGVRILFIVVVGILFFGLVEWLLDWGKKRAANTNSANGEQMAVVLRLGVRILWCGVDVAMLVWLYDRGFCDLVLYTYGPMYRPGVLFLLLTMGIAGIRIFHRGSDKREKLISGLVILVVLITSIGSNNKLYPSINNLFVAAPYTLWESWRFVRGVKDWKWKQITICSFPVKGTLCAFLALFLVQSVLFGTYFVFAEATGVQNVTAKVENNEILRGIKMDPERAEWLSSISAYVGERGLTGSDVILYAGLRRDGRPNGIPALAYYLQLPAAFNIWSELQSYSLEAMEQAMDEMRVRMAEDASYRPVIIMENKCVRYLEPISELGLTVGAAEPLPEDLMPLEEDAKWQLIVEFMREYGYEQTFRNEKFGVWECAGR
ncbi:MAG: hypothetical protein J1E64_02510 [Acetatifactor sp.]|nr:hypothetical protein [Acetatifactor sp.]